MVISMVKSEYDILTFGRAKYDVKYHEMAHSFTRRSCSPSCYRVKICYQLFKSIRLFVYFSPSFILNEYDDMLRHI